MRYHAVNTAIMYNPATLQPVSLGGPQGGQSSHGGGVAPLATPKNRLCI